MRKLIFIILIVLNTTFSFSKYVERETKYFKLIYDEKLSNRVDDFAKTADINGEKVFKFYNFKPKKKYNIIFRDNSDSDNGVTEYDTIKLYFNEVSVFYVEKNYEDWINYLFVHELTHLVINLKSGGIIGKTLIMKPLLQQGFTPAWYQEGLAIYTESKLFDGGRGNSPRFKMYINEAINNKKFDGFKFAGNYNINGNNSYIYGYSFIEYFVAVYGEDELKKAIEDFSNHQIRGPFYRGAGKKRDELLKEWKKWLKNNYIAGEGSLEGEEVIKTFGEKRNLKYYKDKLYFYSDKFSKKENGKKENGIFSLELSNNKLKKETSTKLIDGFEVSEDKIHYSTIIPDFIRGKKRAAVFKAGIGNKSEEYQDINKGVNFFYTGKEIVVIKREQGREKAVTIDNKEIIPHEYGFKFEKFTYGDNKIYFSASREKEIGNYIYCYDIVKKSIKKITEGIAPCFYENSLYYSKNYKGIYNIYRIILSNNKIERLTDVKYGAFEPVADDKGNIYYLNYNSKGYSIYKIKIESNYKVEEDIKVDNIEIIKEKEIVKKTEKENKFKDSLSIKNGVITNQNILINLANNFNEKKVLLIGGKIAYAGQKFNNYELYSEEKREKLGVAALYIHSNGGIPLAIVYGEKVEGEDGYLSGTFNLPYFYRRGKLLFIGDIQIDSLGKKSAGVSLFGAAGYRGELDEKRVKNEFYLKTEKLKINYYFAEKPSLFENGLLEGMVYNMKSSFKSIGYRFKTDEALVVRVDTGYTFKINRGSKTGRTVFKTLRTASENIYAVWNNNGDRKEIIGVNLYIENSFDINYNLNIKFRIGTIEQYDIKEKKILSEKEIPYLGFVFDI